MDAETRLLASDTLILPLNWSRLEDQLNIIHDLNYHCLYLISLAVTNPCDAVWDIPAACFTASEKIKHENKVVGTKCRLREDT